MILSWLPGAMADRIFNSSLELSERWHISEDVLRMKMPQKKLTICLLFWNWTKRRCMLLWAHLVMVLLRNKYRYRIYLSLLERCASQTWGRLHLPLAAWTIILLRLPGELVNNWLISTYYSRTDKPKMYLVLIQHDSDERQKDSRRNSEGNMAAFFYLS